MNNAQMMGYFAGYDTKRTGLQKAARTSEPLTDAGSPIKPETVRNANAMKAKKDAAKAAPAPAKDAFTPTTGPSLEGPAAGRAAARETAAAKDKDVKPGFMANAGQLVGDTAEAALGQAISHPVGATAAVAGAAAVPLILAYLVQSKKAKKKKAIESNELSGRMVG